MKIRLVLVGREIGEEVKACVQKQSEHLPLGHDEEKEITPFATTSMQLEIITLSEVSQKEKDKCHMASLPCGI